MQAIVFNGKTKEVKYVRNHPMPKIVEDNQVIVKVAYSGICGTDLHIIQGEFPVRQEPALTLGHEFSGVVHEAGKLAFLKKGQRVVVDPNSQCLLCEYCRKGRYQFCAAKKNIGLWVDGGWAQYVVVPQEHVYPIPDEVTLEQASLCEPYSCVAHGFDRVSPVSVADRVLVLGAGIIGNLWLTTLHLHGHRNVTVSEVNKARLDIVRNLNLGFKLITPDVLESEKSQYDVIIDCTGVPRVLETSFDLVKPGGKYVVFGCAPQGKKASITPYDIFDKGLTVIGVKVNQFTFPTSIGWLKTMGDRYLDYKKLGIKTYSLEQYEQAFVDLKSGSISKAMFKIE
ncbi:D-altritol 5-dehydrogenase-like [Cydia fagiglandana]|uniref:D-altritol 5-dehydrogenase-like n=1 Tax=Cydia fagiglandana TaxID=1458189 RepID=UPI002FEE6457